MESFRAVIKKFFGCVMLVGAVVVFGACGDGGGGATDGASDATSRTINGYVVEAGAV